MSGINIGQLAKQLEKQVKNELKQIRFAAMKAVNEVAFGPVRQELIDQYKNSFHVRNVNLPKAQYVKKATKENLTATVYFGDEQGSKNWMFMNTVGGTKSAGSGNLAFAGSEMDKSGMRLSSGKIKATQKPGALLKYADAHPTAGKHKKSGKKPKAFKVKGKHGYDVIGIRSGAGQRDVKWLYSLQRTAKIVKRWDFEQIVRKIALEKLPGEFEKQLAKALATAR